MASQTPVTLEKLIDVVGISLIQLDHECSDEHLLSISLFLGPWRTITPHLGLDANDQTAIANDGGSEEERSMKALQRWKEKFAFMATYKKLVEVLLSIGKANQAQKVCKLLVPEKGKNG